MKPTDVLREEHRWILRMLQCLEQVCLEGERRGRLEAQSAAELMALFTHFADGLHQDREECHLFPRLLSRARSVSERTAIGRLCADHEEERRTIARMGRDLLGAIYGEARSLRNFRTEARRYGEVQREHVLHENRELLPLANFLLTEEDNEIVMQGFKSLEIRGAAELKGIFRRIQALSERLGLESASNPHG